MRLARVSKHFRAAYELTPPEIARYGSGWILGEMAVQPTDGNAGGVRDLLDGELGPASFASIEALTRVGRSSRRRITGGVSICSRKASHAIVAMAAPSLFPLEREDGEFAEALVHHCVQDPRQSPPAVRLTCDAALAEGGNLCIGRAGQHDHERFDLGARDRVSERLLRVGQGPVAFGQNEPWPRWTKLTAPSQDRNEHHRDWQCRRRCGQRAREPIIGGHELAEEHLTERAIFDTPRERPFIHRKATHGFLLAKLRIDLPNMSAKRVLPLAQRAAGPLHLNANNGWALPLVWASLVSLGAPRRERLSLRLSPCNLSPGPYMARAGKLAGQGKRREGRRGQQ